MEMPLHRDPLHRSWYSLPVVWLGIAIFAASLSGCIWLIIVSTRYDDTRIPTPHQVFGVPARKSRLSTAMTLPSTRASTRGIPIADLLRPGLDATAAERQG